MQTANTFIRHSLATLAYRCGKTIRNASPEFAHYMSQDGSNTPLQILSHINDLIEWSHRICSGDHTWKNATPHAWSSEVVRFNKSLQDLDDLLATGADIGSVADRLFQGPIADALSHTGQLAMLRRLAGEPIRGENYFVANIKIGSVSENQPAPVKEF